MNRRGIEVKVERSSLGTFQARAARRTVSAQAAGEVVARAEAEHRSHEKDGPRMGVTTGSATYTQVSADSNPKRRQRG